MPIYVECYSLRTAAIFVSPNIFLYLILLFYVKANISCNSHELDLPFWHDWILPIMTNLVEWKSFIWAMQCQTKLQPHLEIRVATIKVMLYYLREPTDSSRCKSVSLYVSCFVNLKFWFLWDRHVRVFAGLHDKHAISFSKKIVTLYSRGTVPFAFIPLAYERSSFSASSSAFDVLTIFSFSNRCVVTACYSPNLHFLDAWW